MNLERKFNWRLVMRNRRYLLGAVGIMVLTAVLIFKAAIPLIESLVEVNKTLIKKDQSTRQLEEKLRRLQELDNTSFFQQQELVESVLPSKKPVLELLTGLDMVAGQAGVKFQDFQVAPGKIATNSAEITKLTTDKSSKVSKSKSKRPTYDSLMVSLTIEGTFGQVQNFLRDIERLAPLTTVTDLELSIKRRDAGLVRLDDPASAELTLDTYYYTQSLEAALTAPLPAQTQKHDLLVEQLQDFIFSTQEQQQQIIRSDIYDLFGIQRAEFEELPR